MGKSVSHEQINALMYLKEFKISNMSEQQEQTKWKLMMK